MGILRKIFWKWRDKVLYWFVEPHSASLVKFVATLLKFLPNSHVKDLATRLDISSAIYRYSMHVVVVDCIYVVRLYFSIVSCQPMTFTLFCRICFPWFTLLYHIHYVHSYCMFLTWLHYLMHVCAVAKLDRCLVIKGQICGKSVVDKVVVGARKVGASARAVTENLAFLTHI